MWFAGFTPQYSAALWFGNDGLVAARNQQFDLIILDLMLPERRGDQILDAPTQIGRASCRERV